MLGLQTGKERGIDRIWEELRKYRLSVEGYDDLQEKGKGREKPSSMSGKSGFHREGREGWDLGIS